MGTRSAAAARLSIKVLIAPIAGCLAVAGSAVGDTKLRDRVAREYPRAVALLESAYSNLDAHGVYTRRVNEGKPTEKVFRFTTSLEKRGGLKQTHRVWDEKDKMGRIIEEVRCLNPEKYTFTAVRYEKDKPLVIRDFGRNSGAFEDHYSLFYGRYAEAMYSVFGTPVSKIMADPSFKIRDATAVTRGGKEFVKIEYDYRPKATILRSGWVEVSPADGWVIQRYESQLKAEFKGNTVSGEVDYGRDEATGLAVPRKSVAHSPDGVHTVEFDSFRVGPSLGGGHFTLASNGLPEVGDPPRRGYDVQPASWFMAAAILAMVVALASKYTSTRLQNQSYPRGHTT